MANYIYTNDGELMHYGVPGMKWGVRKARPTSSGHRGFFGWKQKPKVNNQKQTATKPIKKRKLSELSDKEIEARIARIDLEKRYIEAVKGKKASNVIKEKPTKTPQPKKKKLSDLTNDELKAKIERISLETRYKELAKITNPPKSTKGKDFVVDVLTSIGKNTLTNIGTQAANKLLGVSINKAFGVDSYDTNKRIVNPNKGQSDKK